MDLNFSLCSWDPTPFPKLSVCTNETGTLSSTCARTRATTHTHTHNTYTHIVHSCSPSSFLRFPRVGLSAQRFLATVSGQLHVHR
jgi:hypothetical protein